MISISRNLPASWKSLVMLRLEFHAQSPHQLRSRFDLHAIVFDNWIGKDFARHTAHGITRLFRAAGIRKCDFKVLALAHIGDSVEAKELHGMLNRFSLWIENSRFETNVYFRSHNLLPLNRALKPLCALGC